MTSVLAAAFSLFAGAQNTHVFECQDMRAEIDLGTGALVSLMNKDTGWKVVPEETGRNFSMYLRDADGNGRWAEGMSQDRPECRIDGDSLTFVWRNIKADGLREGTGIDFTGTVKFSAADGLRYSGHIDNHGKCEIETLVWPLVNRMSIPENSGNVKFSTVTYSRMNETEVFPDLNFSRANSNLPEQAFALIGNGKEGLFASSFDAEVTQFIQFQCSSYPTRKYLDGLGTIDAKTPQAARNSGLEYDARANRRLYLRGGESTDLTVFALRTYTGTWHKGADIYKAWKATWFKAPHRPDWVLGVNSWQQLQINSSESRINFRIKDLVEYARECKKYGVDAIQLTGWNWGGQDRGVPHHTIDPRLGTMEEFRDVIAECASFGVRILPFTKFTWADYDSPVSELYKDKAVIRRDNTEAIHPGYSYNTATQLTVMNNRRFRVLCLDDPECRQLICDEFKKVLDLGAFGMVYDENQHHAGQTQCFSREHGHKMTGFVYGGADELGREFYELTQKYNPDFLMVGEASWDLQSKWYSTYTREFPEHIAAMRYLNPDLPIACAVIDHNDINRVNMCLRCRYIISYEPRNFKGHLGEMPRIMEYGKKMDDLRERYCDYLWYADWRDTQGASVTGHHIYHSVFVRPDGKRAVVICNVDSFNSSVATLTLDTPATGELVMVSPLEPDPVSFNGTVEIEPHGAVVIIEK